MAATGINALGQRLPAAHVTLAERFAAAGFHAAAFVGNSNAGPDAGLQQGFDELHLVMRRGFVQDTARFLTEPVEPRLALLEDEDLFVHVHLMQAHGPYGPPEPPPGWVPPAGTAQAFREDLDRAWHDQPTDAARRALHARDVSALDAALGAFLQARLDAWERGPRAGPVVAGFMSDHGERLGEHGEWGHGWGPVGAAVLRVPLLLRAPGRIPSGGVCDAVVQNLDVGATLLELAGVPAGGARGRRAQPARPPGCRRRPGAGLGRAGRLARLHRHRGPRWVGRRRGRLVAAFDTRGRLRPQAPPATPWDLSREVAPAFSAAWDHCLHTQGALAAELRGTGTELSGHSPAALEDLRALGYLGGR